MTTINLSSHFKNSLKKLARRRPEIMVTVVEKILFFYSSINHPSLKLHKLSGDLKDHWAFSIENDVRVIFRYTNDGNIYLLILETITRSIKQSHF
jgi:addiction module RelE/StbE family toxin